MWKLFGLEQQPAFKQITEAEDIQLCRMFSLKLTTNQAGKVKDIKLSLLPCALIPE